MAAAHPATEAAPAGDGGHFLTFLLGEGMFATDIRIVREIIQHGPMTAMPLMPHFVRGVINLRGAVVPVIDLHARFGHGPAALGKKSCIVMVEVQRAGERQELGLLVDAVSAVVEIPATAIEPPPGFGAPVRREFIQAMGRMGQRFVVILAPDKAFDIDEMAQLCEAALAEAA
ncbi:chemotaxis protein CheW [Pseudaquabacterium pictum]|uniref:Chemotaxis protein CheW n=1 Tax=Pseudaquabacterium pictum TaxID=2315236 RepID=A0A480ARD6_9BURK|nr:chemotaxis protein CheW [Rubrivivax pictus]GCL62857.1 chemotaxis protein CheW [Rubrivivax pictus]